MKQALRHAVMLLMMIALSTSVLAANNPGHDSLYVQKAGDTVNGNLNITGYTWMKGITYMQDYLNILANGTTPVPTYAQIAATSTALYIDSPGNLYLNSLGGGGTGTAFIGTTGDTVNLNITGNVTIQGARATVAGQTICLTNGTGCPASLGGANVTSVTETGTTPLSISPTTGNVQISMTVPNCNNPATSKLLYNSTDGSFYCGTDANSGGTGDITDVIAGTGLIGGNASGSATLSVNTTFLDLYNETTRVNNLNTTKAAIGTCAPGQVMQNATATGVQCIAAATDGQTLGTNGNNITISGGNSVTPPYATNAGQLNTHADTYFLDTSTNFQTKTGGLRLDSDGNEVSTIGEFLYINGSALGAKVGIGTVTPKATLQVGEDNLGEQVTMGTLVPRLVIMGTVNNVTDASMLRLVRPTNSLNFYPASVDFKMKSYGAPGAPYLPKTQLTIGLKNSTGYDTGDVIDVLTLRDDGTVGIGTTSPATKLDIDTNSNTLGLRLRGLAETAEIGDIYMGANGNLRITTENTAASNGYVEIDPEDDQWGLVIRDANTGGSTYLNIFPVDTTTDYVNLVVNQATSATGLVIDANQNVGLGTISPEGILDIRGNSTRPVILNNSMHLKWRNSTGQPTNVLSKWSDNIVYIDNADADINIRTSSSLLSRIYINGTSGNVGIGTTSATQKLHVVGSANITSQVFVGQNVTFAGGGYIWDNGTALIMGHS